MNDIVERLRAAEKEIEKVRVGQLLSAGGELAAGATDVNGVKVVAHRADGAAAGDVRTLALDVRGRLPADGPGVVVIIGNADGKVSVVAAVNDEARGPRALGQRRWSAPSDRSWAARAAARTTSRRAAAPTPPDRRGAGPGRGRGRARLAGAHDMRRGVRLGIDPGDARIGVARSDRSGMLATPVETVRRGKDDLRRIGELVDEHEAIEVVVGLPRSLSGGEGPAATKVRVFAAGWRDGWLRCRCGCATSG